MSSPPISLTIRSLALSGSDVSLARYSAHVCSSRIDVAVGGVPVREDIWYCRSGYGKGWLSGVEAVCRVVARSRRFDEKAGLLCFYFFFQAEDGIRDVAVTGVQTCALPI